MSKILVEVTQRDIRCATSGECDKCAIALALKKHFPTESVNVTGEVAIIGGRHYRLPQSVVRFILDFDNERPIAPFSFHLDTEDYRRPHKWH
jgi:hypothetical protein